MPDTQLAPQSAPQSALQTKTSPKLIFVLGIVAAMAVISLIGFIVLLVKQSGDKAAVADNNQPAAAQPINTEDTAPQNITLAAITADDHIRGSLNAHVKIVEYSDLECPFCKRHHSTMQQLINEYSDDEVAWVYRHFPLVSLHPKAPKEAEATECAAELGGNDGFWALIDKIFETTQGNNSLVLASLPDLADQVGLDKNKFTECLDSGKYAGKVQTQYQDAARAGGTGTPYNVIIGPDGQKQSLSGAYPIEAFRQVIDSMLK